MKYTGWGAMPGAFEPQPSREWKGIADELREVLTAEEYASARASTPNAHYTSPEVIQTIWKAMERFGFQAGGHILEPSMGVGHFFGLMPEGLYPGTRRTGVELDSITARIAAKLYPDSNVHGKALEDTALPKDFFDAAVGNIPFGNYPVFDPAYRRSPQLTRGIHDYFLAKSLDVVRPGGLIALITSRYTMDKQDSAVRGHLADGAVLLGALRLPNTAFKANAGTDVTTDILFLQKRSSGVRQEGERWTELAPIDTPDGTLQINEYFVRHPEMMLGRMGLESAQYGAAPALIGSLEPEILAKAVSRLPASVYSIAERQAPAYASGEDQIPAVGAVKEGGLADRDGQIVVRRGNEFKPLTLPAATSARIRGMLQVRDAVREVFRTQLQEAPEETITEARRHLNRSYDLFVSRFGPLNAVQNVRAFADDPDQPLLLSLEEFNPETKAATKTAIFDRRTLERYRPVERVETASEALLVSLNETGQINWPRMEALTGKPASDLQDELGSLAYRNPEGGAWETADRYLSGNVRAKLVAAQASARLDPAYQRNVEALQAVQPPDLEPGEIEARLGSSWIPRSDIRDFVAELLDVAPATVKVGYAESIATWTLELDYGAKYTVSNTTTHGTARFRASDLIEQSLNGRTPTAYDEDPEGNRTVNQPETIAAREKQQQLKDRFRGVGLGRSRPGQAPGRRLQFPLQQHPASGFRRLASHLAGNGPHVAPRRRSCAASEERGLADSSGRKSALGACRGRGKDLDDDGRRDGTPPPGSGQEADVRRAEPSGGPMGSGVSEALSAGPAVHRREGSLRDRKPAAGDGAHRDRQLRCRHRLPPLLRVPSGIGRVLQSVRREAGGGTGRGDRPGQGIEGRQPPHREGTGKSQEAAHGPAEETRRPRVERPTLTFEELGVDQIFVDEADLYKNLAYTTKMNRIAGLPNSDSNRAFDMFLKTRYLQERSDGRGVVFATGTPISNTLAEMYTMLRYLAPEMLSERGVNHFDPWAANFAEAVTSLELAPDGSGYRMHTRFAKFINLPGVAYDVPHRRRRADRRHAEPSAARTRERPAERSGCAGQPRTQGLHPDADRTRRETEEGACRSVGGQHAEDHGRGAQSGAGHAPGPARH